MSDESAPLGASRNDGQDAESSDPRLALSCDEARRQIACFVEEGDLKEAERSLLFMHLRTCPDCKAVLDRNRQLETRLRRAFSGLDTTPEFSQDVLDALPPEDTLEGPRWLRPSSRTHIGALARGAGSDGRAATAPWWARGQWLRTSRLPLAAAALLAVVAGFSWWRHGSAVDPSRESPYLNGVEGTGAILNRVASLEPGLVLKKGDVVEAGLSRGNMPLKIGLASQRRSVASVSLRPAAKLKVVSRSRYRLIQGEAYFDVRKGRPARPEEAFIVVTPLGHVQVMGTAFTVMVPKADPKRVTVAVERGEVQLQPLTGKPLRLAEREEADLLEGSVSSLRQAAAGRLAWLHGVPVASESPAAPSMPTVVDKSPFRRATLPLDWRMEINRRDFRGHTFATALLMLSDDLGRPSELIDLARAANKRDERRALPARLTLVVRRRLPLDVVVRWLARESGWLWDPCPAGFPGPGGTDPEEPGDLRVGKRVPLWPPAAGLAPPDRNAVVEERGPAPFPPRTLGRYLDSLAERATETLVVAPEAREAALPEVPDEEGGSFLFSLDRAVAATGMERAFYDHIWYVAPPATIERITRVRRSIGHWAGKPLGADVAAALERLVARLRVREEGAFTLGPDGRLLVDEVSVAEGGRALRFEAGLVGRRLLLDALRFIERGSPRIVLPTAALDEYSFPEVERNLSQLIDEAARKDVLVIVKGETIPLDKQAFVNRSLSLGRALGWAARLSGLGVRTEEGRLVLDDWAACYGTPELCVLDLGLLSMARPREAGAWGRVFAARLKAMYPEMFRGIACHPVGDRLLFEADRRRLAAAQRLLEELDRVLRKSPGLDPGAWRPAWRIALDENLVQPYRGAPEGVLASGSFVGRLRSAFTQLRTTLIVDPLVMKRVASRRIPRIEARGKTLGEVLLRFAGHAGLRVVIEDGVVWLREKKGP